MKRILIAACSIIFLFSAIPFTVAAENNTATGTVIYYSEQTLENGLTIIDEITEQLSVRAVEKTSTRTRTFKDGDTVIATISIQATFYYDGNTVSVVSKSVTQADTYSGWSYAQDSFTSSGGTVTLKGTLKWLLLFNSTSFTMTLSCDKNGNIT